MKTSRRAIWVLAGGLLVGGLLWSWRAGVRSGAPPTGAPRAADPAEAQNTPCDVALRGLTGVKDREVATAELSRLRAELNRLSREQAVRVVREFLDSGADRTTGLSFKVGDGGRLSESPTLRVFLLDVLGDLDRAVAADYARKVLADMRSSDEWAVALRDLAQGDAKQDGKEFLTAKFRELLHYEPWQREPSVGYLEAFDVAVHLKQPELASDLAALVVRPDNPALAHAAFLALDRMIIARPADMLGKLLREPGLLKDREKTRADYFARVDVRDPAQRSLVEAYLLDTAISPFEVEQFVGVYPSANFMVSKNLLTPSFTPDHSSLVSRDAESLRWINTWLADPRFGQRRSELLRMKARLENFVNQADRAR